MIPESGEFHRLGPIQSQLNTARTYHLGYLNQYKLAPSRIISLPPYPSYQNILLVHRRVTTTRFLFAADISPSDVSTTLHPLARGF